MINRIIALFQQVGEDYRHTGVAKYELHIGRDIHAFYRPLLNPSQVVHVQGYPGMSTESKARVRAVLMDYNKLMEIRERGRVLVGNEHGAVIQSLSNFGDGIFIPYDSKVLEGRLAEAIPQYRKKLLTTVFKNS